MTAGELHTPFTDLGVVAVGKCQNVVMDIGTTGSFHNLLVCGIRAAIENVVPDSTGKQEHILLYDADVLAQRGEGQLADVLPVNGDGAVAFLHPVEVGQQMAQGSFAATGGSHQRQLPSLFQVQVDIVQHLTGGFVGIGHIGKVNDTLHILQLHCIGSFLLRLFVHDLHKPAKAADTVLELLHELDQSVYRVDKQVDRYDKGGIVAKADSSGIQE